MEAGEQWTAPSMDEPVVDLENVLRGVSDVLEYGRLGHLEEAVNRVGRYVLDELPELVEVKVAVTRPANSTGGKTPEVSVEGMFTR